MNCRKTEIIVKEGWKYLGFFSILFLFFFLAESVIFSLIFLLAILLTAFVFRNPERIPYEFDELSFLSPIDGKVDYIGKVFEGIYFKKEMLLISVKSSLFDVSVQRNPLDLNIKKIHYTHGLNLDIKSSKAKLLNEKIDVIASSFEKDILITSIVGKCAKKIYTICDNFKKVKKGDRYLLLIDGKVELYLPLECRVKVVFGEKVKAGESILGYFLNEK